jgi:hypothetical protein
MKQGGSGRMGLRVEFVRSEYEKWARVVAQSGARSR